MNDKKVLLSVKDLHVKFRVRGRILTAIRGISLDFYENESVAIVGESGSGKSVFTKTFAGMLETNGYIDQGSIVFNDEELAETNAPKKTGLVSRLAKRLDNYSRLELGADIYNEILALKKERADRESLTAEESEQITGRLQELQYKRTELFNQRQTVDRRAEHMRYKAMGRQIDQMDAEIKALQAKEKQVARAHKQAVKNDAAYNSSYDQKLTALQTAYNKAIIGRISAETAHRNQVLAREIWLSVARYGVIRRNKYINKLCKCLKLAMRKGADLMDDTVRNQVFDQVVFRVRFLSEDATSYHGTCVLNLAKVNYNKDWTKIRGGKIATVFQDPMTSLNPIITIGKQITSVILKHQNCSETQARARALELMKKVGIPNAENRFDDYPFQYSGGMRQRIVIAIALSCQPKILICDEPTTALDVTIQAQILQLIKDLQKEFGYTIVFITHDLGVVANIADRVAVLYAGQVVELGTCEEVFFDPRHPYTWALLSSLPQLAQRNTTLYSITGTPPSLYNKIVGDAFAPRNPYCLRVDTLKEPPMFQITDTHYAKTWLEDPRAPKVQKPQIIENIHEKLMDAFNI